MRINVPTLTKKIKHYHPGIVCFVGKKIWDVYENVVSKSASNATFVPFPSSFAEDIKMDSSLRTPKTESEIKVETDSIHMGDIQGGGALEERVKVEDLDGLIKMEQSHTPTSSPTKRQSQSRPTPSRKMTTPSSHPTAQRTSRHSTASPRKPLPMDWTQPRPFRLAYHSGHTYFWVTPNTSGLERTPVSLPLRFLPWSNSLLRWRD